MPSLAGPKRPQDRVVLTEAREEFLKALASDLGENGHGRDLGGRDEAAAESFPASDPPANDGDGGGSPDDAPPAPELEKKMVEAIEESDGTTTACATARS